MSSVEAPPPAPSIARDRPLMDIDRSGLDRDSIEWEIDRSIDRSIEFPSIDRSRARPRRSRSRARVVDGATSRRSASIVACVEVEVEVGVSVVSRVMRRSSTTCAREIIDVPSSTSSRGVDRSIDGSSFPFDRSRRVDRSRVGRMNAIDRSKDDFANAKDTDENVDRARRGKR